MSNDPVKPGADADDLLGRWFAHHDKGADEDRPAALPRRVPLAARPSEAAAPRATRPSAAAVLAEMRDAPTADQVAVTGPGVRRGLPGSAYSGPTGAHVRGLDKDVAELDRPAPAGFEPVILRSVRKKTEAKEPEPKGKRGRLSRLRSRASEPTDPAADDRVAPVAAAPTAFEAAPPSTPPSTPPSPPAPVVPAPAASTPVPPPTKVVSYEDVISRALAATTPTAPPPTHLDPQPEPDLPGPDTEPAPVVPPPVPQPQPQPQPQPEPVLPGPDTEPAPVVPPPDPPPVPQPEPEPEPEPVLPGPDTEPAPVVPPPVAQAPPKRRLVGRAKRSRHDVPEEPEPKAAKDRKRHVAAARSATAPMTGTGGAARGLLAAARAATPAPPLASEIREPKVLEPVPMLPVETVVEPAEPSAPPMEMPTVYEFAPRKAMRRFLSLMLIAGLVASGSVGYDAYQSRDTIEIGIAGILTFATMVIWAIRAGATVTRLTVKSGQLEIVRQGGRMVFDLASNYTTIKATGRPGSKKWKVLFIRPGMAPVTVDSTMVDGREFMRVLGFYRPGLVS